MGLHYNYFRDYDPSTGRYIQSDPIGLAGGLNTYAYANGNPLRWSDYYGLWSQGGHYYFMDKASSGAVSPQAMRALKRGSDFADKFFPHQLSGYEHMHAMRGDGVSVEEAKQAACKYFRKRMDMYELNMQNNRIYDAYFSLGMAMHTVQDSTSTVHRWATFSMLDDGQYHGDMWNSRESLDIAKQAHYTKLTLDAMRSAMESGPEFCGCQ